MEFVARIGRLACGDGWRRWTTPSVTLDPRCRSRLGRSRPPLALLLAAGHTRSLASERRSLLRLSVGLRSPSINKPADDLAQSAGCLVAFDDRADMRGQLVHRKGLAQHMHPRLQAPVRDRSVLRIAGDEQDLQGWSADAGGVGHLL